MLKKPCIFCLLLSLTSISLFGAVSVSSISSSTASVGESSGDYFTHTGSGLPGINSAYGTLLNPSAGVYNFGWANKASPTSISDFDISGKHGAGGDFTLNFDLSNGEGISHVAYTGGSLQGLDYRFSNPSGPSGNTAESGSLSLTFSPATAAKSASNPTGGQSLFGLTLFTSSNTSTTPYFSGTALGTDLYWGDISLQKTGGDYGNTLNIPGANFDGQNGAPVNFDFYIAKDVLTNLVGTNQSPLSSLHEGRFYFNKANAIDSFVNAPDTITYYENGVPAEDVPSFYTGLTPEISTFNFGSSSGGTDNYVLFEASNSDWSDANVLLSSVPEPETYGAFVGVIALLYVALKRGKRKC